jgi:hypothetical protein
LPLEAALAAGQSNADPWQFNRDVITASKATP